MFEIKNVKFKKVQVRMFGKKVTLHELFNENHKNALNLMSAIVYVWECIYILRYIHV